MKFGSKLKSERERLGLTQAGAAVYLGISKSILEKWESGNREPMRITQEGALARLSRYAPSGRKRRNDQDMP